MANLENKQPDLQPGDKKGKIDASLYPTSAKYARRRKQRNIACIVTGVAATGVLILGIISFLGKVSGQFTIKMDPRVAPSTLKLFDKVDGSASELLTASGLSNAHITTADTVLDYVDTLKGDNNLYGSNNLTKKKTSAESGEETTIDLALVFTFYAENISSNEDAIFDYKMTIDDYVSPTNGAVQPYTYLRVALFENIWKEDGTGSHDFTVYALESVNTNAAGDKRECLSTYRKNDDKLSPSYTYDGNHGYCEPFEDAYTIFNRQAITLKPEERMRFTAVCWLEGNDPDCYGTAPEGASFTFSMAFSAH